MPKYRVYGSRETVYYTDIKAADGSEAYDKSLELETHKWFEKSTDETIEPFQVEQLNNDK